MLKIIALAALGAASAAGAQIATGSWAGDRMIMMVTENGATLQSDCAGGRIAMPIKLTPTGEFTARGDFSVYHGGPDRADASEPMAQATYRGKVDGDVLTLSVIQHGQTQARRFQLRRGARIKLIRCL